MSATIEKEAVPSLYTKWEVRACLPNGWTLRNDRELLGDWDSARRVWKLHLFDGADVQWTLEVKRGDIERQGRAEALRQAMNHLYRDALG